MSKNKARIISDLNNRGIAHYIVPLAVVIFAIVGTFLIVFSSAASTKPAVKSISYSTTVPWSYRDDTFYCSNVTLHYSIKTSGKVDTVTVNDTSHGLTHIGNNIWKGAITHKICQLPEEIKTNTKVNAQGNVPDQISANYGANHGTKQAPAKLIKLKVKGGVQY